jgi:hypothetical protein
MNGAKVVVAINNMKRNHTNLEVLKIVILSGGLTLDQE